MQVTKKSHRLLRLQNIAFVALFIAVIGMLAWVSSRYTFITDWTVDGRNTLSPASTELLKRIEGPVSISAFARDDSDLRKRLSNFIESYQRYKDDISLTFINPDIEPQQARELGIRVNGELVIQYKNRSENLQDINEQAFTNALQRVARSNDRFLAFLSGHGERSPNAQANHDLGDWAAQLQTRGFNTLNLNLGTTPQIPDNIAALIIASPQVNLLPGEVSLIGDFLAKGGNLLWLAEPEELHGLGVLAEQLGIEFLPGMVVDPTTQQVGIDDPRFTVITEYGPQAVTSNFDSITLYPQAAAIEFVEGSDWLGDAFLISAANSWSETGDMVGQLVLDPGEDIPGPLNIGVMLGRTSNDKEQRVVVIGDGDFLSNAYLGNAGNLDLGLNLINWLSHDDNFINIPVKTAQDISLDLSPTTSAIIGLGFLFALPLLLLGAGFTIWWRRKRA